MNETPMRRTPPMRPPEGPRCGAVCDGLTCDRNAGHAGAHRGYHVERDTPMFWRNSGEINAAGRNRLAVGGLGGQSPED
jgi:hypothetical protein